MSLAEQFKQRAITFGVSKVEDQRERIEEIVDQIKTEASRRVDGADGWGASYLHLDLTSVTQEEFDALSTPYGLELLRSSENGFQVETNERSIVIRWATQAEIDSGISAILNPTPVDPGTQPEA